MRKMKEHLRSLLRDFRGVVLFDEPMSRHTSFRIGGPADALLFPEDETELARIVRTVRSKRIPFFMLGGGTNLLVGDKGVRGIVISLSSRLAGDSFKRIIERGEGPNGVFIYAGAGVAMARLLKYTVQKGLTGIEFTAGIPGSLGGAIVMNAGSFGKEMGDILESVRVVDRHGNLLDIPAKEIAFNYRSTHIPGVAVAGAVLRLQHGDPERIERTIEENLQRKKKAQPTGKPNAGSIFKNPEGMKAWELIDSVGMRGAFIGGASVSSRHTNFIVNNGGANAKDVLSLIRLIGRKVEKETGITLELEVRIVGV